MEKTLCYARRVTVTYTYRDDADRTRISKASVHTPRLDRKAGGYEDDGGDEARKALTMGLIPPERHEAEVTDVEAESIVDMIPTPEEAFDNWPPPFPPIGYE